MRISLRNRFILVVSSCYTVFALVWIFLSDQFLLKLHTDIESMLWLSTAKGIGFVVITVFLLIFALRTVPPTADTPGKETFVDVLESRLARQKKHSLLTYVITIMITLATLLVREHLAMPLENRPLLTLVMFPIILSVYLGGLWPGLLSTAIALCWLFLSLIPPLERFNLVSYIDLFQLSLLLVNGIAVSLLSEMFRRSLRKAKISQHIIDSVVSGSTDAIFIKDMEGRYLLANAAMAEFIGHEVTEIIGSDDSRLLPDSGKRDLIVMDQSIMETGKIETSEKHLVTSDGRAFDFMVTKGAISLKRGEVIGMFGIFRDVTEYKHAEERIRAGNATLDAALSSMSDALFISDLDGNFIHINEAFATFHRFKNRAECAKTFIEYPEFLDVLTTKRELVPVDNWAVPSALRGETGIGVEFLLHRKDNGEEWYGSYNYAPVRDKDGLIIGSVVTCRDITDIKRNEEALKKENEKNLAILHNAIDGIHILNTEGNLIEASDSFCEMLGYQRFEILGKNVTEWDAGFSETVFKRRCENTDPLLIESRYKRKDGSLFDVEINSCNLPLENKQVLFSSSRDITERKVAEKKIKDYLQQVEHMMLGTLQVVANIVEVHDPYTAGHERHVGIIAADIAREMGWPKDKCDNLQLIGMVHDIGKINIPAEILSKPGRLSAIEYDLVKTHAEFGYQILKDIEFPLPIARIIREHHERMDGSGYPQGLKGDETLPESRILAVADVLEAMSSHRPYRPSLGLEATINEIESHRGILFDPDVVDAMLRLIREKGYQLPV
jgi:PAS domain S-box-containing protein/putative nucleotidyltransferase with HDIG domain